MVGWTMLPGWSVGLALFGLFDLAMLALKLLAVVGGAALGALGTGLLLKLTPFRKMPRFLVNVTRILGGILAGLLVWVVFNLAGPGGLGRGGGGWGIFGWGSGSGSGKDAENGFRQIPPDPETETRTPTLRIQMRGGTEAEKSQRFYLVEGEKPRNWDELEKFLGERKKEADFVIHIVIRKESVDEHSPAVRKLENWAQDNDVFLKKKPED